MGKAVQRRLRDEVPSGDQNLGANLVPTSYLCFVDQAAFAASDLLGVVSRNRRNFRNDFDSAS
jgi:hypothetical protein